MIKFFETSAIKKKDKKAAKIIEEILNYEYLEHEKLKHELLFGHRCPHCETIKEAAKS